MSSRHRKQAVSARPAMVESSVETPEREFVPSRKSRDAAGRYQTLQTGQGDVMPQAETVCSAQREESSEEG